MTNLAELVLFVLGARWVLLVWWEAFNVIHLPRRAVGKLPIATNF